MRLLCYQTTTCLDTGPFLIRISNNKKKNVLAVICRDCSRGAGATDRQSMGTPVYPCPRYARRSRVNIHSVEIFFICQKISNDKGKKSETPDYPQGCGVAAFSICRHFFEANDPQGTSRYGAGRRVNVSLARRSLHHR
jgi:hypothetical protein